MIVLLWNSKLCFSIHPRRLSARSRSACMFIMLSWLTGFSSNLEAAASNSMIRIYMLIWLLSFVFGIFALNFLARSGCFFRNIFKCKRTLACIIYRLVRIWLQFWCLFYVIISPTIRTFLHFVDVRYKYYKKKKRCHYFIRSN